MRRLVFLCGVLLLLAASLALLRLQPPVPAVSGPPAATLVVLTGSAQLTRTGSATAVIARGGDPLRPGDRVATGPGTRARIGFVSGDQARLDSGTLVLIVAATPAATALDQASGRTWIRSLTAAAFTVRAGGRLFQASGQGTELAVAVSGSTATAEVLTGGPLSPAEQASPWFALNQALDRDPSPGGPSALGDGMLLPGEESAAQQAVTVPVGGPAQDIVFTADWTAGNLELEVIDPDGAVFDHVQGPARPLSVVVPKAAAGGWEYRVRQLEGGEEGDSWFVVISQLTS